MLYAMIAKDKPNHVEHRMATRPEHLAHLESLGDALVFAGALLDTNDKPNGSMVVLEAQSLAEAEALAAADPFVKKGIFESYTVQRWNWAVNNPTGRGQ
jgi:uncharacterized protein YciI